MLESLRVHANSDPKVVLAVCAALAKLLEGSPNHAAKGDDLYNEECEATAMRIECGRLGAAQIALELIHTHTEDALTNNDALLIVCAAYLVLENLVMDYENKVLVTRLGAIPGFVAYLEKFAQHARIIESAAAVLINCACGHDENKMFIGKEGAVLKVIAAMNAHVDDVRLQDRSCALLCNLAAE